MSLHRGATSCRYASTVVVCLCCLFSLASVALAADFAGKVVGILNGDTIEVLHHPRAECIRLYGIDCSEKRQAW